MFVKTLGGFVQRTLFISAASAMPGFPPRFSASPADAWAQPAPSWRGLTTGFALSSKEWRITPPHKHLIALHKNFSCPGNPILS